MLGRIVWASQRTCGLGVRMFTQQVSTPKEKWDLLAGVLIERLPTISRDFTKFEQEYAKMLADIEFENSMKSDHEIRHERDLLMAERLKKGDVELDLDESVKQTAQDAKDAYKEELKKFQFASRTTEADSKGDRKSLERKLDETLMLLVEQTVGEKKHFLLPQGLRNEGETLRETADRVIREKCGDSLSARIYGNSPVGFYKYKYPSGHRQNAVGAKVFFYRAVVNDNSGPINTPSTFEWLTKAEMDGKLPSDYSKSVHTFVL